LELVATVVVVIPGEPVPGLAGGDFEELPQPASVATPIANSASAVAKRFVILDLRRLALVADSLPRSTTGRAPWFRS
jgi:hypothetical protein